MEATKDQSASSAAGVNSALRASKLRYPLRSATKCKDDHVLLPSRSPASKSGRSASNVSKSVSVLDLSGKEKSAKPPRRLSIPTKSAISPLPRPTRTMTPISETRPKRSYTGQGKNTPASDVSKSMSQRKFSVLSSASYWLSQIKLSESANKHSISLGFFKLALDSGCEPLQRMRDELKSYAHRHNLAELEVPVKELFKSYSISEALEQLQVAETVSQVPEEGIRSSDEDIHSSTSDAGKLKPKSLNSETVQAPSVAELTKKDPSQKNIPTNKTRASLKSSSVNVKCVADIGGANMQKKSERLSKHEANKEKAKLKKQGKKSVAEKDVVDPASGDKEHGEEKENVGAEHQMEEISSTEVA